MSEDNILTPQGWIRGRLLHQHGKVTQIEGTPCDPQENDLPYLLPGFIDLHVHGGGGKDIMEGGDAFETIARTHLRFGTTSLLATTMTAPPEEISLILGQLGVYCEQRQPGTARVLGVHLEGPFINPGKLGAQPNFAHTAISAEVEDYLRLAPIRVITIAPEIAGHAPLIRDLSSRGIRMQIGHTLGSYEEGVAALEAGATSFTHLYNAMSPLHHREPGIVGAALAHARYAELIPDLLHVHPGAMRVALRSIPCLYCVTDSTAAAGMPDGEYKLGSHTVTKCLGGVRLADGTLAGSTLTMDQALRNLVKIGLPLAEASQRLSQFPADYLGLPERGRLQPGSWADCVRLDRSLTLTSIMVEGEAVDFQNA
ncbi:N-acetylglucosamine-6-phosphate deacetylase [Pseudomonas gingeri]|uniref:N-acetylglucosamine-6-phosphate deacetylase n=1 Tax=Pseudomonas gingeri TaxID=117681 RepID=UPI0015A343D9|nr:N-acetylglucosamine-6-phosphate deacetylase [Pseudomonas gingeri]NWA23551.1 N-acetylglucosamine-6-phosphate deacetylase [Pseudomonas gingeri]NWD78288.1 N-acetylglucosamine-6-phosphate deacetylase [Pseudomonas gingeri]